MNSSLDEFASNNEDAIATIKLYLPQKINNFELIHELVSVLRTQLENISMNIENNDQMINPISYKRNFFCKF